MKVSRKQKYICLLLSIVLSFSGFFFGINASKEVYGNQSKDETTTISVKAILPGNVVSRSNEKTSTISKSRTTTISTRGFGATLHFISVDLHTYFVKDSSTFIFNMDAVPHKVTISYIHNQDGKK